MGWRADKRYPPRLRFSRPDDRQVRSQSRRAHGKDAPDGSIGHVSLLNWCGSLVLPASPWRNCQFLRIVVFQALVSADSASGSVGVSWVGPSLAKTAREAVTIQARESK